MSLALCPSCRRHAKATEAACPFCTAPLAATTPRAPLPRLSRSALVALGTAAVFGAASSGCGSEESTTQTAQDAGSPDAWSGNPVYGGPPDDPIDAGRDAGPDAPSVDPDAAPR